MFDLAGAVAGDLFAEVALRLWGATVGSGEGGAGTNGEKARDRCG